MARGYRCAGLVSIASTCDCNPTRTLGWPAPLPASGASCCVSEGYTSSLAADALLSLGVPATDVIGGFHAWRDAGLPTVAGGTPIDATATAPSELRETADPAHR